MLFPKIDFKNLPFVSLSNKSNLPKCSGIYFVLNQKKEVLYVGKSINLFYRWRDHHRFEQLSEIHKNKNEVISIFWLELKPHQEKDLTLA